MSQNNDCTTGNLLDYEYFKDHYQLIATELSKQTELENFDLKQQINFIGRLEENNATMFFIIEKKEETTFVFSQNSQNCCLICIKMETQKIVNLLNDSNNESLNFQEENGTLLMTKIIENMAEEIKMIQPLNLKQKSLN